MFNLIATIMKHLLFKCTHAKLLLAVLAIATMTVGCKDDNDYPDVDGQAPTISLSKEHIQSEIGRQFTIAGTAADKDGLKSIRLQNSDLQIDKTIDLLTIYGDSLLHNYSLSYNITTAKTQTGDSFPIKVTVTDVGGRETEVTQLVTMDGDFTPPSFTAVPDAAITVLMKQNTKLNLRFSAVDDKALDYVLIAIPEINFSEKVSANGKTLDYNKQITLPAALAVYNLTITAVDKFALSTTKTSQITVSEMPDFAKMYLADVETAAELNSDLYGVPMLIDHTEAYTYTAHYYNKTAGTKIRFVPQKTDFEPICFGIDPNNTSTLTDDPSISQPIVLSEAGKYYEITFNVKTGAYNVKTYTPTTAKMVLDGSKTINYNDGSGDQPFQICLAGAGLPDTPNWTTNQNNKAFILKQDTQNPYILYRDFTLTKGTKISFTISATHWWGWWPEPYWRFDKSGENEYNVKNGGDNMKEVVAPADGNYRFEFDYSLLRSRIIPVK